MKAITGQLWLPVWRRAEKFRWALKGQLPRIRPMPSEDLGANYDSSWARRRVARFVRALLLKRISRPTVDYFASPTVHFADHLDGIDGPVIFASNHASHIDTSLLLLSLPKRFRRRTVVAAAADYFFDRQWKAALWALWFNVIPIEREKVGRRSADLAAHLINEGWNLAIFPEGTRSRDGSIAPFRGGAAYLSIRCNVPVIPVYLGGTSQVWPPKNRFPTRGRTDVYLGSPLSPKESEKARDFNNRVEAAVRDLCTVDETVGRQPVIKWP